MDAKSITTMVLRARAIADGLKKNKFVCGECNIRCADGGEYTRHCKSEQHAAQVREGGSQQLEKLFLDFLRRSYGYTRVAAETVYHYYTFHWNFIPLRLTRWATPLDFINYLGTTDKVKLEDTPDGLFITFIHA